MMKLSIGGKNEMKKEEEIEKREEKKMVKKKSKSVHGTVAIRDYGNIEKLVDEGKYRSSSDFVQVAIRKLLAEEIGGVEVDKDTLKIIKQALEIE